jgi:amino acid adenylation domain-containing protein
MTSRDDITRAELLEQAIRLKKAAARSREPKIEPRSPDESPHLGEMQRSLWLAHQMDRLSPAYNLTSAYRARGSLDVAQLQRALNEVVARHRLLRSVYRVERDTVQQIVQPVLDLEIERFGVGPGEGLLHAADEAGKPFDLEQGPLVRLLLIEEESGDEPLLVLVLHHILADERSLASLWEELAASYVGGPTPGEPRVQYDDYVSWAEQRRPAERQRQIDFWRQRLDPLPEDLRLPFEGRGTTADFATGRLLTRTLSTSDQDALRGLAAATGSSPFMVFAFAFRLLLHRYTEGQPVAFATPASTRSHPDTAKMIGYFLNPIVVPAVIDEELPVRDAITAFSRELRDLLAHASVPFEVLAEELAPPRQRDRHPIFQTMFVYQEAVPPPELGAVRLQPVTLDLGASKFDLTLFATDGEGSLGIAVEFRADRFDEAAMHRLLDHYESLLAHLPEDLGRATADVPLMSAHERSRLHALAQGPASDSDQSPLLPLQILDQARRIPRSPAVICDGVHASYGEVAKTAYAIAASLGAAGVTAGDRVGLCVDRSAAMVAGILGTHLVGAAYVPLDPSYPKARNTFLVEDAEVTAVVTSSAVRNALPVGPWSTLEIDRLDPEGTELRAPGSLSPDDPAYILYTSGSTGRPKGVVVTHGNLRASNGARGQVYSAPPTRFLLVPSVAFDSSVAGIFWTLAEGGTLVIPSDREARDPRRLAELVAEQQVTSLLCVPSLYHQMLTAGGEGFGCLETAIVAGESCPSLLVEDHFRLLPGAALYNEYGPTEGTVWATVHRMTPEDGTRAVAIGRPVPGVQVDVLDQRGRAVPQGIPGSGWIAGPTIADGYWGRPDLTAECFAVDPETGERRYRTGDRMLWTEDERLLFLGREDEQIKLRGFRIEPGEIEASLLEIDGIERSAVVARPLGTGAAVSEDPSNRQLVGFVETTSPDALSNWRRDLAARLPEHLIPSRLVELDRLPLLPNGKIDRQNLRRMVLESDVAAGEEPVAASAREQSLISLWEGLLGRSGIRATDNFFELGGHSLLVVEMTVAIEQDFEVELAAADVFENPTVRELAARIEQRGGRDTPPYRHLFPIQPVGRKMPFIVAIPHFFTDMFADRFRGERPVYGLRGVGLRPEGNLGRWRTMSDLGEELVDEIRRRFPGERCILAGYSFGASMAFEAVRVMEQRGIPVDRLYLIAPMPIDFFRLGPVRIQIDGLRQPIDELSRSEALRRYARANNPLTLRPYRRVWRWLAIEPWRRFLCLIARLRRLAGLGLTHRLLYADVRVDRFRLHAAYRPQPISTPTVIFNAIEPETDAAATWRPFFDGPLTVHDTSDPHLGQATIDEAREVILRHLSDLGER